MLSSPLVSVIISTWNRGKHLIPTLRSVKWQTYPNIEILVVGDGCDDDTKDIVSPFMSQGVRWFNLPKRTGSQSFPNNFGIAQAKGEIVAYLGHDDIWAPDHLSSLVTLLTEAVCDVAVAGCIYYGPPGSHHNIVTGLFESDDAKFAHFFPPSSLAHRRALLEKIGPWRAPDEIKPPVDAEFLLRAAQAGLTFSSTGRVTVHKFASGHRYLSYLAPDSDEQEAMITKISEPGFDDWLNTVIDEAKRQNRFMIARHVDYDRYEKGELAARNRINRGLQCPTLREVTHEVWINQNNEARGLDWHAMTYRPAVARYLPSPNPKAAFRWSGPSPTPRILIPFCARSKVRFDMNVRAPPWKLNQLTIMSGDQQISWQSTRSCTPWGIISFDAVLKSDGYTVLTLNAPTSVNKHGTRIGIAVGPIRLMPLSN